MLKRLLKWLGGGFLRADLTMVAASEMNHSALSQKDQSTTPTHASKPVQPGLLRYFQEADLSRWSAEKMLFHGCTDTSKHTDVIHKRLDGDFKWMSEDPFYATDYAFYQGFGSGRPFLFVCTLGREAIAIKEGQTILHRLTNWGAEAPWRFPIEFGPIAIEALGTEEPFVFLDHFQESTGKYKEILVPAPSKILVVLDVIPLPSDKEAAKRVVEDFIVRLNA